MKSLLTKDLLAGASATTRNIATFSVLAVGAVAAVATSVVPAGILQVSLMIPTALIAIMVALRISGPQDAKSFRLYRATPKA